MSMRLKANLIFALAVLVLLCAAMLLRGNGAAGAATVEARREAALLTAQAMATEQYTREKVAPLLNAGNQGAVVFVPESTPFYAAATVTQMLERLAPGDTLRQVVLDPVGVGDRPTPDERAIIERLRHESDPQSLTIVHNAPDGRHLVLATPIRQAPGVCATCYSSRADAPAGLLDVFGAAPGFNRKPGEIVGITLASVPLATAPGAGTGNVILWLVVASLVLWAVFNLILEALVLRPLGQVAAVAEQVSLGRTGVAEFGTTRGDEIGALTLSFNRLRRSMESAIGLIDT